MGLGLCVTPVYLPSRAELAELNPEFLRSIIYKLDDIELLTDTGYPILATLNNECKEVRSDWSGWGQAVAELAERANGRVFGVCVGNEFDSWWQGDESDVPPSFAANLIRQASAILKPYGIKTIATSAVSPRWQEYLQRMMDLCRDHVDYADLHAYGQRPNGWKPPRPDWGFGNLEETLRAARDIAGKPVCMSEIGVMVSTIGDDPKGGVAGYLNGVDRTVAEVGADVCPFASWFAWRDEIGKPEEQSEGFGLRASKSAGGQPRNSWHEFRIINADTEPIEPLPPPEPAMSPITAAFGYLWRAANPLLPWNEEIAGFGIPTYWRQHIDEMGSPLSPEIDAGDGTVLQAFTRGVYRWNVNTVERVT